MAKSKQAQGVNRTSKPEESANAKKHRKAVRRLGNERKDDPPVRPLNIHKERAEHRLAAVAYCSFEPPFAGVEKRGEKGRMTH